MPVRCVEIWAIRPSPSWYHTYVPSERWLPACYSHDRSRPYDSVHWNSRVVESTKHQRRSRIARRSRAPSWDHQCWCACRVLAISILWVAAQAASASLGGTLVPQAPWLILRARNTIWQHAIWFEEGRAIRRMWLHSTNCPIEMLSLWRGRRWWPGFRREAKGKSEVWFGMRVSWWLATLPSKPPLCLPYWEIQVHSTEVWAEMREPQVLNRRYHNAMSKTKESKTTRATGARHIRFIRLLIPEQLCRAHLVSSYVVRGSTSKVLACRG